MTVIEKAWRRPNSRHAGWWTFPSFEAFEAGTLKAELCNEKVRDLHARLDELAAEKRDFEARRERLELPSLDREMLSKLVDEFEETMENGTNQKKKHLLHQLVKKVLIHDRRTIEVWYCLPNKTSVRRADYLAPWAGLEPAT